MKTLNRVTMIGHLASDVKCKTSKSGKSITTFPLATNRNVKEKDGKFKERVDYHNIVSWGALADVCGKFLVKGSCIMIEGKIVNNSFTANNGEKHYRTEIILDNLNVLKWKPGKTNTDIKVSFEELGENSEEKIAKVL